MEKDIHYYATYVASILSGYDEESVITIAQSSQYVDDCTIHQLVGLLNEKSYDNVLDFLEDLYEPKKIKSKLGIDFIPVITSQTIEGIVTADLLNFYTEKSSNFLRKVWSNFHFLPGNMEESLKYNGSKHNLLKKFTEKDEWGFRLVCLPSSELVKAMIDNVTNCNDKDIKNYLIGISMHVLADTWSHMWFSGTPSWYVNEIEKNVFAINDNEKIRINWDKEKRSPGLFESDLPCLGHGRIGHIPDLPWLKYEYTPHWNSEANKIGKKQTKIKDNPVFFYKAVNQMIVALKSIKNNESFDTNKFDSKIDKEILESIKNLISEKQSVNIEDNNKRLNERCNRWENYIEKNENIFNKNKMFENYNKDKWQIKSKELRNFHIAAREHISVVKYNLNSKYGIDLNSQGSQKVLSNL